MARNSFYSDAATTEPNMRKELTNMFDGVFPEVAKKQRGVLRIMRKDDDDEYVDCACVDNVSLEGDKDYYCPYCLGESKIWNEKWCDYYKMIVRSDVGNATREGLMAPGLVNTEVAVFFLRWSYDLTKEDKIIEVKLKKDGAVYYPYERKAVYRIDGLIPLRSDNGKLEFWKAACYEEEIKFLNGPNG